MSDCLLITSKLACSFVMRVMEEFVLLLGRVMLE